MALISCQECSKEISHKASACPHCGAPTPVNATRPDGPYEMYYENGQLKAKGIHKDGEFDGPLEMYYENGQLKEKSTLKDGELHGPLERYNENGQLQAKGICNMGEKCGEWLEEGKTVTYDPCPGCDDE